MLDSLNWDRERLIAERDSLRAENQRLREALHNAAFGIDKIIVPGLPAQDAADAAKIAARARAALGGGK